MPSFYELGGSVGAPFPTSGGANLQDAMTLVNASADGGVSLTDGGRLTTARREAALADFGDAVFLLGGEGEAPGQPVSNDELLSVDASCKVTGVRSIPPVLTDARSAAAVVVSAPFAYVLGGLNRADAGVLDDVQVLEHFDDGGLGVIRAIPGALPDGRAYHRAVRVQGRLFVLGGITASSDGVATTAILSAPLFPDGGLGLFADAGNLSVARAEPAVFVDNSGHLLVAGGLTKAQLPGRNGPPPPTALDDVEGCDLAAGICQTYATEPHLTTARAGFEMQPGGPGVLLLVGGITGSGSGLTGTATIEQLALPSGP